MWIKRNTLERQLADAMGYEYCTLFDTARSALRKLRQEAFWPLPIPSNVCPELRHVCYQSQVFPVSLSTGMANVPVQLYGYRCDTGDGYVDLDPLMTGFLRRPFPYKYSIISFGPKKMLDAGGGGALLSNERFRGGLYFSHFPECLRERIEWLLESFAGDIARRRRQIDEWDRWLGDSCTRIPCEQIMPWRVMRRIPEVPGEIIKCDNPSTFKYVSRRDRVVRAIRDAGYPVGTNYPPLPGVTDLGAIQWGREVINFFPASDAKTISDIVRRTLAA